MGYVKLNSSVAEEAQRIERALEQRDLEPHFEHEEQEGVHDQRDDDALHPGVLPQDDHEQHDVNRRNHIQTKELNTQNIRRGRDQHRHHTLELLRIDKDLNSLFLSIQDLTKNT